MSQNIADRVTLAVREYADVFPSIKAEQPIDWTQVETKLQNEMEWTQEGAAHIAALARDYGAFVLRNALALATVFGVEDGSLDL